MSKQHYFIKIDLIFLLGFDPVPSIIEEEKDEHWIWIVKVINYKCMFLQFYQTFVLF